MTYSKENIYRKIIEKKIKYLTVDYVVANIERKLSNPR